MRHAAIDLEDVPARFDGRGQRRVFATTSAVAGAMTNAVAGATTNAVAAGTHRVAASSVAASPSSPVRP